MKTKITFWLFLFYCVFTVQTQAAELPATSTNISTVYLGASDGDVILLAAGSYNYGFPIQTAKIITIKKDPTATTTPVITAQLTDPAGDNGGLIFDGVKFNRSSSMANGDYALNYGSTMQRPINTLQFKNCEITGFGRSFIRTQGAAASTATIGSIVIDNCLIHDIGNSYVFITTNHIVGSLSVTNSTLYNYGGEKFFAPGNTTQTAFTLTFTNNTVYKWSKATYNFIDVASKFTNASVYNIKDNIFNLIYSGTKGTNYILNCTNGGTLNAANNLSVDFYGYNFTGTGAIINNTDMTLNTGILTGVSAIPFADVTTANFQILASSPLATASTSGGIIGDPRWLKALTNPATITTSVSPSDAGTTSPTSNTVNVGEQVTVSATKAFGYTFKEWRDVNTNTVVSTNSSYTFTLSANTSLLAVFDVLTTCNFIVNKEGTGSTWGNVTLSPTPINGKYETGTVVTATIVPNAVTTFSKWDDNATDLSKNIIVTSDQTLTATFDVVPFIVGWDFKAQSPTSKRVGDFYSQVADKGFFSLYNADGSDAGWLASTSVYTPAYPAARMWTPVANFATPRYFHASFSTLGYKDIQVKSKVGASYHAYPVMTLQYSTDSITFTKVNQVDIASVYNTGWVDLNYTLPADANNKTRIYVRWVEDATSSPVLGSATDVDGSVISNVYIYANSYTTKNIETKTNDIVGFKSGNQITLNNVPENSNISVYNFTGKMLKTDVNKSSVYSASVTTPCIIKVVSLNSVKVIKLL